MRVHSTMHLLASVWVVFAFAGAADAIPIRWNVEAVVRRFANPAGTPAAAPTQLRNRGVVEGALVTGYLEFESELPDLAPAPDRGLYDRPFEAIHLEVGSIVLSLDPGDFQFLLITDDGVLSSISAPFGLTRNIGPGSAGGSFQLIDPTRSEIVPDALPVHPPDLSVLRGFDEAPTPFSFLSLKWSLASGTWDVGVEFTSMTLPEPSAGLLVGLALGAISLGRRRRTDQSSPGSRSQLAS